MCVLPTPAMHAHPATQRETRTTRTPRYDDSNQEAKSSHRSSLPQPHSQVPGVPGAVLAQTRARVCSCQRNPRPSAGLCQPALPHTRQLPAVAGAAKWTAVSRQLTTNASSKAPRAQCACDDTSPVMRTVCGHDTPQGRAKHAAGVQPGCMHRQHAAHQLT